MKQTSSQIPEQTSSQIPEQTPSQIQENPDNIHVRRSRFHIFEGLRYLIKTKDDLRIFIENSQVFSEELKNLILWEIEDLKENGTLEVTKKTNQQSDIKDFIKFIGFMVETERKTFIEASPFSSKTKEKMNKEVEKYFQAKFKNNFKNINNIKKPPK